MLSKPSVVDFIEAEPIARFLTPDVIEISDPVPIAKLEGSTSVNSIKPLVIFKTFLAGVELNVRSVSATAE